MTNNEMPKLWPLKEVMDRLGGISRQAIGNAEKAGAIRLTRIGNRVFMADDELRRIVTHGVKLPSTTAK